MLAQQIVNGLALGSMYALIAVGFSLIFSVLDVINFSHGSLVMLGVYVSLTLGLEAPWLGLAGILPLTVVAVGAVGIAVERWTIHPLRRRGAGRALALLTTLGAGICLEALAQLVWGAEVRSYPLALPRVFVDLGPARISYTEIVMVGLSLALMASLQLCVRFTRWGRAIRAIAQNPTAAALMGIDVDRNVRFVFALGAGLAAVAGVLMGLYYNFAQPSMGFAPGITGFVAAVVGGMGTVVGAGLGGLVLGMAEVLGGSYLSFDYQDAIAFLILIVIFLVRPEGLLGVRAPRRA